MGVDSVTWQALGLVLTVLGLGTSALIWTRRGPARGLRAAAWSLIPLAAALTGTLRLVGDVVGAVGRWGTRLVFDPLTWTGFVVAALAGVLFVVSGWMLRREPARSPRRAAKGSAAPRPVEGGPARAGEDPDLAEIEALLRGRGIT